MSYATREDIDEAVARATYLSRSQQNRLPEVIPRYVIPFLNGRGKNLPGQPVMLTWAPSKPQQRTHRDDFDVLHHELATVSISKKTEFTPHDHARMKYIFRDQHRLSVGKIYIPPSMPTMAIVWFDDHQDAIDIRWMFHNDCELFGERIKINFRPLGSRFVR